MRIREPVVLEIHYQRRTDYYGFRSESLLLDNANLVLEDRTKKNPGFRMELLDGKSRDSSDEGVWFWRGEG